MMPTPQLPPRADPARARPACQRGPWRTATSCAAAVALLALSVPACAQYAHYSPWYEGWLSGGRTAAADSGTDAGGLAGQRSRYAFGVGGALRLAEYTLFDFELPFYGQKFAVPQGLATPDDLVSVKTRGIAFALRQVAPLGPLEVFMGVGAGWYESALTARRDVEEEDEFVDTGPGYQVSAGINLVLDRQFALGVEARRLWLDADFGPATRGLTDIGGRQVFLTLRFRDAAAGPAW